MTALDLVKLTALMKLTSGRPEITIGLIDGPVAMDHPDLAVNHIRKIPGEYGASCTMANSAACMHGTFVAGILSAKRDTVAPAICPNCTLQVRPIFAETPAANGHMPGATPDELAAAIVDCVNAGARVINLSAALNRSYSRGQRRLTESLNHAARRNVIVVAASGNHGLVGGSAITGHPWVISVAAYDMQGRLTSQSNLGRSVGRLGLGAPGEGIISLGTDGNMRTLSGTSTAAPFVTGAIALLFSQFPTAMAVEVRAAITQTGVRRRSVVPPLMNAWSAYQILSSSYNQG